jgi:RNA recognition motif-containing protein
MQKRANLRLPPEINRVLYVRNLPYKITAEEMYDIFGKYGAIRQIRLGNTPDTRGRDKLLLALMIRIFFDLARHGFRCL